MKCLACNKFLTDREASRKYENWRLISEGEDRYIGLCDSCIVDTDLNYVENSNADNEEQSDDEAGESNTELY